MKRVFLSSIAYMIGAILFALSACNPSETRTSGLSDEDIAALRSIATSDSAIVMSRNWDKLAAEYTSDAVRMPPNEPTIIGKEAIRHSLEKIPQFRNFNLKLEDLHGDGEIAYMRAAWSFTLAPTDTTLITDSGKILVVLRKQSDGSWLRVADAWNSDAPAK